MTLGSVLVLSRISSVTAGASPWNETNPRMRTAPTPATAKAGRIEISRGAQRKIARRASIPGRRGEAKGSSPSIRLITAARTSGDGLASRNVRVSSVARSISSLIVLPEDTDEPSARQVTSYTLMQCDAAGGSFV